MKCCMQLPMGATILEKGVSPDELHSEQDILHSLPVSQVQLVMKKCNNIKQAMEIVLGI